MSSAATIKTEVKEEPSIAQTNVAPEPIAKLPPKVPKTEPVQAEEERKDVQRGNFSQLKVDDSSSSQVKGPKSKVKSKNNENAVNSKRIRTDNKRKNGGGQTKSEPVDSKEGIVRVQEVYRVLEEDVRTKKRKAKDKTYRVTEDGDEVEVSESESAADENSDDNGNEEICVLFSGNNDGWGTRRDQKIRIKEYASLGVYFERYAHNLGRGISHYHLRFIWDGQRLDGDRSAADYGMQDGDHIDVFEWQTGGSAIRGQG